MEHPQLAPTLLKNAGPWLFTAALVALPLIAIVTDSKVERHLKKLATRVLELETILEAERVLDNGTNTSSSGDTTTPPAAE
jgi:hypothetical protein